MSYQRYSKEFKSEAVKQATERGHSVSDVLKRLDVSAKSLYQPDNDPARLRPLKPE